MNHIWTQISCSYLYAWVKKEKNVKSQEIIFEKSQKVLASRAGSSPQTKAGMVVTWHAIEIEWIAIECSE